MHNYKKLEIWKKSREFCSALYAATAKFPMEEKYGLTNQLRRASVSIPSNIAEGCGRNSQMEFAHFLNIAMGSANESEYHLILSKDLLFLKEEDYSTLFTLINEIKGMLIALIAKVRAAKT